MQVTKTFLAGLVVAVPLIITIWIIIKLGGGVNQIAVDCIKKIPPKWIGDRMASIPGLGIATIVVLIMLVGVAARFWLTAQMLSGLEGVLERVPLVKSIYTSIRDMMRFFGGGSNGKVALYTPAGSNFHMLAVVTNDRPIALPADQADGMVTIWLPMSYNLGGFMLYVPSECLQPVNLTVEELMKLAATAELGAGRILGPRIVSK